MSLLPPTFRLTSMAGMIDALMPGETWCKATRFDPWQESQATVIQESERLRSTIEPAIRRVRELRPGKTFTAEAIDSRTHDWHVIVAIAVTRMT